MTLLCPTCSAETEEPEFCWHTDPLCASCCRDGEHHWREPGYNPRREKA